MGKKDLIFQDKNINRPRKIFPSTKLCIVDASKILYPNNSLTNIGKFLKKNSPLIKLSRSSLRNVLFEMNKS
jgi:hypothetical protein